MAEFRYPSFSDSFDQGEQTGERLGASTRDARAFRSGGYQGMETAAGRTGDREGATYAQGMRQRQRTFDDQQQQHVYDMLEKVRPWILPVIRRSQALAQTDPNQARQFLTNPQFTQRLRDIGLTDDNINAGIAGLSDPDPQVRARTADNLTAEFTQYQDPNWTIRGSNVIGINQGDGSIVQGGTLPQGSNVQLWTPEEVAAQHLPAGTAGYTDPTTGLPHIIQQPHYQSGHFGGTYPDDGYDYHGG